jgi:agmatine deiminase
VENHPAPRRAVCFKEAAPKTLMITDWDANTAVFADLLPRQFPELWDRLAGILAEHRVSVRLLNGARDVWCRDFLAVQVGSGEFVQFRYQPDYLTGFDHLRTPEEVSDGLPFLSSRCRSDLILDGGNIVTSGRVLILTDKVYRDNPGRPRQEVRSLLRQLLNVGECVLIPKEAGDPIGHADGIVRFLNERAVVMNDYTAIDPAYGTRVRTLLERQNLHVALLPYSLDPTVVDGIPSAAGNHVNFLRIGNLVVVPAYGMSSDAEAVAVLNRLLPGCRVESLDCSGLALRGGVLNCIAGTYRTECSASVG